MCRFGFLRAGRDGVSEEGAGNREAEGPPPSDHDRLSTIPEEPSDITEDARCIHDDPGLAQAASEAALSCLRCRPDEGNYILVDDEQRGVGPRGPPQHDWHTETYAVGR